jgi:mannitol/fructose-specific phosphotransferase system IIA component (Ntr-type)
MSLRTANGKVIEYKLSERPKCLQHRGLTLAIVAGNFRHSRGIKSNTLGELMELRDFFSEDAIKLELEGTTKDDILKELIALLGLDDKSEGMLFKMLKRRENLGSTGIGRGIAIPHCRSLVVNKLRVAFGRKSHGLDFKAIDEKPVYFFFLIVAPPLEVSNQYLPVLGKIAQFSKEPDVPDKLLQLTEPKAFMALLQEKSL